MSAIVRPTETYLIPEYKLEALEEKMRRLLARAKDLGIAAPVFEVLPGIVTQEFGPVKDRVKVPCVEVRVSTASIKLPGWSFCGYIEHFSEGNRLYALEELPEWCRSISSKCDHCQTSRRRKGTYIVRSTETGDYKQVGSTCLDDFIGSTSAAAAAAACAAVVDMHGVISASTSLGSELSNLGPSSIRMFGVLVEELLCYCMESIRRDGYRPRKVAEPLGMQSTGDRAFAFMEDGKERARQWKDTTDQEILDHHLPMARKVVEHWQSIPVKSDFEHNCNLLAKRGVAKPRDANMVAAMVSSYHRHMAALALASNCNKAYVGAVAERLEIEVMVDAIIPCQNMFMSYMHLMRDSQNRQIKWFASTNSQGMEPGKRYLIAGTVKKHDEYKGTPATILTRCSVKQALAA